MTREELIARIEAGETGHDLNVAIAKIAIPNGVHVPSYTTSIDAAVSLVGDIGWSVSGNGWAGVFTRTHNTHILVPNNPAAALVAAWLKATA